MLRSLACHALFLVPLAGALVYQAAAPVRPVPVCGASLRAQAATVDQQLAWLLALVNERDGLMTPLELRQHFHADYLAEAGTPATIAAFAELADLAPLSVRQITRSDEARLVAQVDSAAGPARVSLTIDRRSGALESVLVAPSR